MVIKGHKRVHEQFSGRYIFFSYAMHKFFSCHNVVFFYLYCVMTPFNIVWRDLYILSHQLSNAGLLLVA